MALKELNARYATSRAKNYKLANGEGLPPDPPERLQALADEERFAGKEKLLVLGRHPTLSLADARLHGAAAKVALGERRHPGARTASLPVITFEAAARAWHANRLASLDHAHASRLLARLERDAYPAFGKVDLRSITSADVLAMVGRVEATWRARCQPADQAACQPGLPRRRPAALPLHAAAAGDPVHMNERPKTGMVK